MKKPTTHGGPRKGAGRPVGKKSANAKGRTAVTRSHEQSIGNNATWKYRKPENHPIYRNTRKGHYCGDFWSKDK